MEVALTPGRVRAARAVALAADLVQIAVFPTFSEGVLSPFNDVLDVAVGAALIGLLGWHWALVPTLVSEMVPVWDVVPTWTAAVWLVTRGKGPASSPPPQIPPPAA
jgi:hypothetical protein